MKVSLKYLAILVVISVAVGFLLCLVVRPQTKTEIKPIVIRWPDTDFLSWIDEWNKKWPRPLYFEGEIKYIDSTTPVGSLPITTWSRKFAAMYTMNNKSVSLPMEIIIEHRGFIDGVTVKPMGNDSLIIIDDQRQLNAEKPQTNFDFGLFAGADLYPDIEPQIFALVRYKRLVLIGQVGLYKIENQDVWQAKINGGIYYKLL